MGRHHSGQEADSNNSSTGRRSGGSASLNQGLKAADPISELKSGLASLGLHREALDNVSRDTVVNLGALVASGGKRSSVIIAMWNATAESAPNKLENLVTVMSSYSGSITILETFLLQVGNWNPFLATERAQILVLPASDNGSARGASGHVLTGITYCAYDRGLPVTTTGYISGKQAITKIFEAFNPDRITEGARTQVRSRRQNTIRAAMQELDLRDVTLADLDVNPSLAGEIGSRVISRNLAVYQQLRFAIEQCKSQLSELVYSGEVVLPAINSMRVSHDSGRQFYGWFEDHFRENPNAPVGIKVAFESLRDEDVQLSPEEESHYVRGLLAYQRTHSFINKRVALGGLVNDLGEYDSLSPEDPLRDDSAVDQARRALQTRVGSLDGDLSIADFSSMLENAAMVELRCEMNRRVLAQHCEEFNAALKHFDFVPFKDGKWREDSLGDSVPMDRLKQHLYGAKIGVAEEIDGDDKKRALLGQGDFRHIMDAQFLWRLVKDEEKLLNAKPVGEFRNMVEGVLVAYRKARIMDAKLVEYCRTPAGAALVFDREHVAEALQSWRPVLPFGNSYKIAERWLDSDTATSTLSLQEVARRVRDLSDELFSTSRKLRIRDQYRKFQVQIEQFATAGLYLPAMDNLWRELVTRVREVTPAAEIEDLLARAVRLHAHPMLVQQDPLLLRALTKKYLSSSTIAAVVHFLKIEQEVEEMSRGSEHATLVELRSRLGNLHRAYLFQGGEGRYQSGVGKISLHGEWFADFAKAKRHKGKGYYMAATIFEPRELSSALDRVERDFIPLKDLGEGWVKRAKTLCSNEAKRILAANNFALVDDPTYRAASILHAHGEGLVSRSFAALVDRLMPAT